MKIESKCPYCDDILCTEYKGEFVMTRMCSTKVDHQISFAAYPDSEEVYSIKVFVANDPPMWAFWQPQQKTLLVSKRPQWSFRSSGVSLPWFDPDLTKYHKMCDKIRTYILFS